MGDLVPNIAKGAVAEKIRDGADLQLMILRTAGLESDAVLRDKTTVTDVLSGTTDEATNTGYARKTITNGTITLTVDQANDRVDVDVPDSTWTSPGVSSGDGWSKAVYSENTGSDATRVPCTMHDFVMTPDGSDITLQTPSGIFRAS